MLIYKKEEIMSQYKPISTVSNIEMKKKSLVISALSALETKKKLVNPSE